MILLKNITVLTDERDMRIEIVLLSMLFGGLMATAVAGIDALRTLIATVG